MLEFNEKHKVADLSAIKNKLITTGKVIVSGVLISSVMMLSGCGLTYNTPNFPEQKDEGVIATAVMINDKQAIIVDLIDFDKDYSYGQTTAEIQTTNGDIMIVGHENTYIITGENTHQSAEKLAADLVGADGQVICYNESNNYHMSK